MIRTLLAFLLLCSPVLAQTPPDEQLAHQGPQRRPQPNCIPTRPPKKATDDAADFKASYAKWAIEQNALAYENAARLRDEVNGGVGGTVVSQTQVYGWSAGLRNGGFNNLNVRQFNTVAPGCTPFGGGPVWIINPFCPPAE